MSSLTSPLLRIRSPLPVSLLRSLSPPLLHHHSTPTTATTRPFSTSPAPRLARMSIIGRLADAPELVATSSGQDVVRYALGTSHGSKDNRQTSWWKVACFQPEGKGREVLLGLGKGDKIYVEGDCSMNKFQTKEGTPASALSIVQRTFEILDRKDARPEGQVEAQMESE